MFQVIPLRCHIILLHVQSITAWASYAMTGTECQTESTEQDAGSGPILAKDLVLL